jgi:hypothetical protein
MNGMSRYPTLLVLAMLAAASRSATAAPLDDIKVEVSQDLCEGAGAHDKSFIVYATNLNANQTIDANFKYDSNPAQQHFILFDARIREDRMYFHLSRSATATGTLGRTHCHRQTERRVRGCQCRPNTA